MTNENESKVKKKVKPNSKYNTYQGKSERIKEFLGYGTKESSTETYMRSLTIFENFIKEEYKSELDDLFQKLESNQLTKAGVILDVYRFMASYLKYLIKLGNEPNTIKNRMNTAKALIITTTNPTITIDPRKYKHYVKLPRIIKKQGKGLSKETTIKLIKGSTTRPRLSTIIWFLAATSCRIGETLLLRISDLHLDGKPNFGLREPFLPYISIRGEITKTGQDRTVLLTSEITEQLRLWIKERYKERNKVTIAAEGKTRTEKYTPVKHPDDYLFLNLDHNYDGNDAARFVYKNLANELRDILKNLELADKANNGMRLISFHKIRRGVRTRISDLGFKQSKEFADFYMGHETSDYYYPTDDDYKRNFLLCQNELTYLDQTAIQKSYGEMGARLDKVEGTTLAELDKENKSLKGEMVDLKQQINKMQKAMERLVRVSAGATIQHVNSKKLQQLIDQQQPQ